MILHGSIDHETSVIRCVGSGKSKTHQHPIDSQPNWKVFEYRSYPICYVHPTTLLASAAELLDNSTRVM